MRDLTAILIILWAFALAGLFTWAMLLNKTWWYSIIILVLIHVAWVAYKNMKKE